MEHAVFYPGPDAAPAFRRFSSLDEAVRFVEHLRNVEGVDDVTVHMLSPVPLAFRAYYKVEVPAADVATVPEQAVAAEPVMAESVAVEPDAAEADADPDSDVVPLEAVAGPAPVAEPAVASNGKKSLGFFAH